MDNESWDWGRLDADPYGAGSTSSNEEEPKPVRPPSGLFWGIVSAIVASLALLAWTSMNVHLAGYALAGLVSVSLVAAFKKVDAQRRQSGFYSPSRGVERALPIAAVAAVAVAGLHAWFLAHVWAA